MSRRSDYFSTMLGSSFQEGLSAPRDMLEIQVTDVEPPVLYAALHWVYTDRVDADMPAQQLLQVRPPPPPPPALHPQPPYLIVLLLGRTGVVPCGNLGRCRDRSCLFRVTSVVHPTLLWSACSSQSEGVG